MGERRDFAVSLPRSLAPSLRLSVFDNPSIIQRNFTVGDIRQLMVMGDEQQCRAALAVEFE